MIFPKVLVCEVMQGLYREQYYVSVGSRPREPKAIGRQVLRQTNDGDDAKSGEASHAKADSSTEEYLDLRSTPKNGPRPKMKGLKAFITCIFRALGFIEA